MFFRPNPVPPAHKASTVPNSCHGLCLCRRLLCRATADSPVVRGFGTHGEDRSDRNHKCGRHPHRELLERGNVFVNIADLDVPCVGLRVPLPGTEKHAFVSFTKEWFDEHTDHEVATALVEDLQKALSEQD